MKAGSLSRHADLSEEWVDSLHPTGGATEDTAIRNIASNDTVRVAVIILNWNKPALTRRCLEVARSMTASPAHWIVVDNNSAPPIDDLPPDVTLIRNDENCGFAGGVNIGLSHAFAAGAEYAWLLNNDAEPLPGALEALLEVARADHMIGLASAVILNSDAGDVIASHGGVWETGTYRMTTDPQEYTRWANETPERIWLVGTAMLVTRRLIERIGYFDEALFAYWEDTDISRRSAAAGFRNIVVPAAMVRHPCGKRAADQDEDHQPYYYYYMTRNEMLLLRKTGEPVRALYWLLRRILRWHNKATLRSESRRAIRRGIVDGLLGRGGRYQD